MPEDAKAGSLKRHPRAWTQKLNLRKKMIVMTKKSTAKGIVAAAIASALTFGAAAAPALAIPQLPTENDAIVAQSAEIGTDAAYHIASSWYNVDEEHIDQVSFEITDYEGHVCYEVTMHEDWWYNPVLDDWFGNHTYVVYVGAVTGNVYGAYDF